MPSGTRPTRIVATTARVRRPITETLRSLRLVIQSCVPRGCTATPHGPLATRIVSVTVHSTRFTSDTVSSRKLVTAAISKLRRHTALAAGVTVSQRPALQTSSPLQTSPSLHFVPSGSMWQSGEQQSPVSVLPSSHVSPNWGSTMPSPQTGTRMVVLVVVVAVVLVVLVDVVEVGDVLVVLVVLVDVVEVVDVLVVLDVLVDVVLDVVVVVGGRGSTSDGTQSSRRWMRVRSSLPSRLSVKMS